MAQKNKLNAFILGICILLGLSSLGYLLGSSAIQFKEYERSVTVKGLSEREFPADIVIWPIQFTAANNQLEGLYSVIDSHTKSITDFLTEQGIDSSEVSFTAPAITDKSAQQYGNQSKAEFR